MEERKNSHKDARLRAVTISSTVHCFGTQTPDWPGNYLYQMIQIIKKLTIKCCMYNLKYKFLKKPKI